MSEKSTKCPSLKVQGGVSKCLLSKGIQLAEKQCVINHLLHVCLLIIHLNVNNELLVSRRPAVRRHKGNLSAFILTFKFLFVCVMTGADQLNSYKNNLCLLSWTPFTLDSESETDSGFKLF